MEYGEVYPERARPSMPNDSASRYGPADEPAYQGFHTYATSDLYDTNGGADRWPDNWTGDNREGDAYEPQPRNPSGGARGPSGGGRDYWGVLMWTIFWYAIPALVLILRALFLPNGSAARAAALGDFISNSPIWLAALLGGLVLAVVLRWASDAWRAATIGFCAAVVSGGAITVLYRIW